jgi:hypothetical protein
MDSSNNEQAYKTELVNLAIQSIKDRITSQRCADPWNDQVYGVAWIHNELDLFNYLYQQMVTDVNFDCYKLLSECSDVNSTKQILSELPLNYLEYFKNFLNKGGSDNCLTFKLRVSDNFSSHYEREIAIYEYLTNKKYESIPAINT